MHSQTSVSEESSSRRRRAQKEQFPAAKSLLFEAFSDEENMGEQAAGPTTRRQWTQWCQRPHEEEEEEVLT